MRISPSAILALASLLNTQDSHAAQGTLPEASRPAGQDGDGLGPLELSARGGCAPDWMPTSGGTSGLNGTAYALETFDDGSGLALYVGGAFTVAGDQSAAGIAKLEGEQWSPLGDGVEGTVRALTVFDDGSGPALYAGGWFSLAGGQAANGIAKWDGSSWSPLGDGVTGAVPGIVYALQTFDDGSGPALYAAGRFTSAGGQPASRIARWDGSSWSPLGSGVSGHVNSLVNALAVFDDGSGPALYVAGWFTEAGGAQANHIAKWDGVGWSPLVGLSANSSPVHSLAAFDDGSGPALYMGGSFQFVEGVVMRGVARWNGNNWSGVGSDLGGFAPPTVYDFTVFDDGSGTALYAVGDFFSYPDGPENIAKWNGTDWEWPGPGVGHQAGGGAAMSVLGFDDGTGPAIWVAGQFDTIQFPHIAKWANSGWVTIGSGLNAAVDSMTVFDDGNGPALYVGGQFTNAGGPTVNRIGRWDGKSWSELGDGASEHSVGALAVYDDGSGPALYAGGFFSWPLTGRIAKWNGSVWSSLSGGVNAGVLALEVFDDGSGPALYAAGHFTQAGGQPAFRVAKYDGSGWSALGGGLNGVGVALAVLDDGSGPALYAGGSFTQAGGQPANYIAKWDGSGWSALGSGMSFDVRALAVFDDGGGPALYAGGSFTQAGGQPANSVAKWDGSVWSALGEGLSIGVRALTVFDDGSGPALYAGGRFTSAGGQPANRIAKWDGSVWTPLGAGVGALASDEVRALQVFDDGWGPVLHVGGQFLVSPAGDHHLARWGCDAPLVTTYCEGDGTGTACPCSNDNDGSLPSAGCASSAFASGCRIGAGGSYPSAVAVLVENAQPGHFGLVLRGTGEYSPGVQHFDGLLCVGGNAWRSGLIAIDPSGQAQSAPLPQGPPGAQWNYQFWYRDPGLCTGSNLSNGLRITW